MSESPDKKRFPKSGSEEEFWDRCEEAARLMARGVSYRQIGVQLDVTPSGAYYYVRRYFQGASRFFAAAELRERLAFTYNQIYSLVMRQYAQLEAVDEGGKYVMNLTDKERVELKLACNARQQSLIDSQGRLYGFGGADVAITLNMETPSSLPPPISRSNQMKLRALLRLQRKIRDGDGEEMSPTELRDAVDTSFTEVDRSNGDQADQVPEEPPEPPGGE